VIALSLPEESCLDILELEDASDDTDRCVSLLREELLLLRLEVSSCISASIAENKSKLPKLLELGDENRLLSLVMGLEMSFEVVRGICLRGDGVDSAEAGIRLIATRDAGESGFANLVGVLVRIILLSDFISDLANKKC